MDVNKPAVDKRTAFPGLVHSDVFRELISSPRSCCLRAWWASESFQATRSDGSCSHNTAQGGFNYSRADKNPDLVTFQSVKGKTRPSAPSLGFTDVSPPDRPSPVYCRMKTTLVWEETNYANKMSSDRARTDTLWGRTGSDPPQQSDSI